ncbi:MAG: 3-hydroxyacyl-CoA dehydrogenase NAD-binding domain-containing protein [Planctomycetaceae bacterium]|jgi:3-hydroxybutyryl-CoA dehydrogenase|nr:3-hydroxybutyryl-CoA dehydrogenase [Phycisphaerales bacterium]MCE2652906.1 3-hydroxyacyl-CoA dehydrogenase NAD-binding domain-containing protein [Planctomycetaceae bacterium]
MSHGVKTLGVLGAGQMGGGIAQVAAVAGITVKVFDAFPGAAAKCAGVHKKSLGKFVEKAKISQADADAALARISYVDAVEKLTGCDWIVEAVVEDVKVKKDLFGKLAAMYPDEKVVLASNTSSISITDIATAAGAGAHRVIGMHFFNPVPLMQLVEVIPGLQTSPEVIDRTVALATAMGKTPLKAQDRAGFVSNRVLMPMINEAFYAWMEGVAEPEAIDGIMKLGCNFPMGPLVLADFIGLDTCVNIMNVLADGLNNDRYRACPLLKQLVTAGRLGVKSGRGVYAYPAK